MLKRTFLFYWLSTVKNNLDYFDDDDEDDDDEDDDDDDDDEEDGEDATATTLVTNSSSENVSPSPASACTVTDLHTHIIVNIYKFVLYIRNVYPTASLSSDTVMTNCSVSSAVKSNVHSAITARRSPPLAHS